LSKKLQRYKRSISKNRSKGFLKNYDRKEALLAFIFLLPSFLIIFGLILYPVLYSFYMSFHSFSLRRPGEIEFIGLKNYIDMFHSRDFQVIFLRTCVYTITSVSASVLTGLSMVLLLNEDVKGKAFFRSAILVPWAIPAIVVAFMWKWILHPDFGAINGILFQLGLLHEKVSFLGYPNTAFLILMLATVYMHTPVTYLIIFPFIRSIPLDLYDATKIDGCNRWQRFRHLILPLVKPGIFVATVMQAISSFQIFTLVYGLTGGGPAGTTTLVAYYTYLQMFGNLEVGMGSAAALLMFAVIMSMVFILIKFSPERVQY